MAIDYSPSDPVAGQSRATSPTEVERWTDYADTIADVDSRITADVAGLAAHIADAADAHDASAVSIADAGAYFTGTDVEAALQELGAGGGGGAVSVVGARLTAAATTLPASTATALNWADPPTFDTDGFWSSGTPTILTVPVGLGGYYVVTACTSVAALASGKRWVSAIQKNGTTITDTDISSGFGADTSVTLSTGLIVLAAGDAIRVTINQLDAVSRSTITTRNFLSLDRRGA